MGPVLGWLGCCLAQAAAAKEEPVSSIFIEDVPLEKAVRLARRIILGTLLDKGAFRFPGTPEISPQPEGEALVCLRIRVLRSLKGKAAGPDETVCLFHPGQWYRHTQAAAIKGGVVSYHDPRYRKPVPEEAFLVGKEYVFFLGGDPAPAAFPKQSAFLACDGAYDLAEREKMVLAILQAGVPVDYNHAFTLPNRGKARFADSLELVLLGSSRTEAPGRESARLQLTLGSRTGTLQLSRGTAQDGTASGETQTWGDYCVRLHEVSGDGEAALEVKKVP